MNRIFSFFRRKPKQVDKNGNGEKSKKKKRKNSKKKAQSNSANKAVAHHQVDFKPNPTFPILLTLIADGERRTIPVEVHAHTIVGEFVRDAARSHLVPVELPLPRNPFRILFGGRMLNDKDKVTAAGLYKECGVSVLCSNYALRKAAPSQRIKAAPLLPEDLPTYSCPSCEVSASLNACFFFMHPSPFFIIPLFQLLSFSPSTTLVLLLLLFVLVAYRFLFILSVP